MNLPSSPVSTSSSPTRAWHPLVFAAAVLLLVYHQCVSASCVPCGSFQVGVNWGTPPISALTEASGLAASALNAGVLWTHNDGSRGKLYAISTNGAHLATFTLNEAVGDVEDIAVGPGPVQGLSYLYVGDIGGNSEAAGVRQLIKILRVPEPTVSSSWAGNPVANDFDGVESFTLFYPDGYFDAETLLLDPISTDVLVVTKTAQARVYRAHLTNAANGSTLPLEFVCSLGFSHPSGGDISSDGAKILLRREEFAMLWARCDNEAIGVALARSGVAVPVIGPPEEPNGEAVAFLRDSSGYITLSEGSAQPLYCFRSLCPAAPRFSTLPVNQAAFAGGTVSFQALASGYPDPSYRWFFNGTLLAGQTSNALLRSNLTLADAGSYSVTASNANGTTTATASLSVSPKPNLRITEVQSSQATTKTADWWELTSFESQPVNLKGWRFNDSAGALTDPYTITNDLSIAPGESIVFVEGLSPSKFLKWWGTNHFPSSFQVVTYSGSGLGLAAEGDGLRLWSDAATDTNDTVASVDFGAATAGVSFNYDPVAGTFGALSQLGINGVFQADASADIGSPGRILAPATSPQLNCLLLGERIRIQFNASVGRVYSLEVRTNPAAENGWTPTGETLSATNNQTLSFEKKVTVESRFYRVGVK